MRIEMVVKKYEGAFEKPEEEWQGGASSMTKTTKVSSTSF